MVNYDDITLDEEEQWIEDHIEEFKPCENQKKIRESLQEAAHNTMEELREKKKAITINIDGAAISYFKELAEETKTPYQTLINMYLVQCARERKKVTFV